MQVFCVPHTAYSTNLSTGNRQSLRTIGSCLKTGQHFIFVIIYLLLPIKCIIFDSVSKILFIFFLLSTIIIMILILKILLHNVYKIINLRYPTYVYQFLIFLIIPKIECWPVFKQDPNNQILLRLSYVKFLLMLLRWREAWSTGPIMTTKLTLPLMRPPLWTMLWGWLWKCSTLRWVKKG